MFTEISWNKIIFGERWLTLDDTRTRIISAAMKAVREYGLEGVRIQNVSDLAGISPGALYRHFNSKDQLIEECFTYVDKQAAEIFEHLKFNPVAMAADPIGTVKSLWLPYFRFWVAHPDETVFYHRFRDSARGEPAVGAVLRRTGVLVLDHQGHGHRVLP